MLLSPPLRDVMADGIVFSSRSSSTLYKYKLCHVVIQSGVCSMSQAELLLLTDGKTAVQREEDGLSSLADDIVIKFTPMLASMCKASSG